MGLLDAARNTSLIQGIQQIFQNAGYNQQQTGASIASGLAPRAFGGVGLVAPAYASEGPGSGYVPPQPQPTNNNGGGGSYIQQTYSPTPQPTPQPEEQRQDPLQAYRDQLNQSYANLENQLTPWKQQQEQGIQDIYNNSLQDINLQKDAGLSSLNNQRGRVETNQVRNLKDLASAMGQSFNSYANQLGVMGAGDSSAAKVMLPYALSRTEAQQRGEITRGSQDAYSGIDERESNLHNMVLQETNNLNKAKMQEMNSIADWFNNAKYQIAQMKGQDVRGMAENVLMQALQAADQVNQQYTARQNSLRDWATSVSTNVGQLKTNLNAVSDPSLLGNLPQMSPVGSRITGYTPANYQAPVGFGFGGNNEEKLY